MRFSLWAPNHERIGIELNEAATALPMRREADGWHRLTTDRAGPGSRCSAGNPVYLILPSLNSTCLRSTGSYFFIENFSVMVRVFFLVT